MCLALSFPASPRSSLLEAALDTLDKVLASQPNIIATRFAYVDSLKSDRAGAGMTRTERYIMIGQSYRGLDNDSSIHYFQSALESTRQSGDTHSQRRILPLMAERLSKAARFTMAYQTLDTIDISAWTRSEKINYYSMLGHICLDAASYRNFAYRQPDNTEKAIESLDSLLTFLHDSRNIALIKAQRYFLMNEPAMALGELNEVFKDEDDFSPEKALMAHMLATYYKDRPEHSEEYIYYLALSAISDARRANGEALSLARLGEELLKKDDSGRAFIYLATAGELIGNSNSLIYGAEIAPSLSKFANIWAKKEESSSRIYVIVIVILTILLCAMSGYVLRQKRSAKKETDRSKQLSDSIISRDHYINQLLNLCGVYVEGLEEFNRYVARKLKVNQVQDLYKTIESGKMLYEQAEHFFEVFDEAIINIFPDFIEEVNSLLQEDKKIIPHTEGRLTPELRIIAFMRLGVTDSAKLSKFLGLSVNTVYTYRNRMKSRAKNREMFEDNIMNLGKTFI